jgi:hypothetical protein
MVLKLCPKSELVCYRDAIRGMQFSDCQESLFRWQYILPTAEGHEASPGTAFRDLVSFTVYTRLPEETEHPYQKVFLIF